MRAWRMAFLLLAVPALATGQSLGDAARKESERRKKNREAGVKAKVYTEGELASATGRVESPSAEGAAESEANAPEAETTSASEAAADRGEQEQSWRRRVAQATARRDRAKKRYEELNRLSLVQGEYYVDENGKPVITSLGQLRGMIERAKADYDAAEKALADVFEQARRSNIPPGWLR